MKIIETYTAYACTPPYVEIHKRCKEAEIERAKKKRKMEIVWYYTTLNALREEWGLPPIIVENAPSPAVTDADDLRICPECKRLLDKRYFTRSKNGEYLVCLECAEKVEQPKTKMLCRDYYVNANAKRCRRCGQVFPLEMYSAARRNSDGLESICRCCKSIDQHERRAKMKRKIMGE